MTEQTSFSSALGTIVGLPDHKSTRATTIMQVLPLIGNAQTHVIQTIKTPDGYLLALQVTTPAGGLVQLLLPPKATDTIYRQRAALADRSTPASRKRQAASNARKRAKAAKEARRAKRASDQPVDTGR